MNSELSEEEMTRVVDIIAEVSKKVVSDGV